MVAADLLPSLEGVELGSSGKVNVESSAAENQKHVRCVASASVLSLLFQTVSYAQFLYPTNALARMKSAGAAEACGAQTPQSRFRASGQRNPASAHPINAAAQEPCRPTLKSHASAGVFSFSDSGFCVLGVEEVTEYDPNLLSDPQWPCGRHKRVLIFASYMVSVCPMGRGFCLPEFPAVSPGYSVSVSLWSVLCCCVIKVWHSCYQPVFYRF